MAKTKAEKIAGIEEEIRQLENRRRQLVQERRAQERKDRMKRLCRRMGLFESLAPNSILLTEEQFRTFLEQTVATEHSRCILDGLTARNAAAPAAEAARTARTGTQTGAVCKADGRCPYPFPKARARLYTTCNVVYAVLQTAFCSCWHKRERRAKPAEKSAARGDLSL